MTKQMPSLWSPLLSLRHDANDANDQLLISDALQCRRALVSTSALLDLVAADFRDHRLSNEASQLSEELAKIGWRPSRELDEIESTEITRWWDRDWHPSLEYFLWSRIGGYIDAEDEAGKIRRAVLSEYLVKGSPPPRIEGNGAKIRLPEPLPLPGNLTIGQLLMNRRTIRGYTDDKVSSSILSSILHYGLEDVRQRRTLQISDSIDYLQSHGVAFEFFVVLYDNDAISPGIYHYKIHEHCLEEIQIGMYRNEMESILVGMKSSRTASWTLAMAVDFEQYQWRYRHERALRHLYIASGRFAQRLIITALAYDLGTLPTPATRDRSFCELLQLDPSRWAPMYTLTMGPYKRKEGTE